MLRSFFNKIKIKFMAKSNNIPDPYNNLIKYHDKVFDKFLTALYSVERSGDKKDKGDDPHLFI